MGNMKYKIAAGLAAIASLTQTPAFAVDPVPASANSGRLQERFSSDKPVAQITDEALIQDQKSGADLKNADQINFVLNSVVVEGNTIFTHGELEQFYKDKIGKKVSLADMYAVREEVTKYYREKGY